MIDKKRIRELIQSSKLKIEKITIPEWEDLEVEVKELSGSDYIEITNKSVSKKQEIDEKKFFVFAIINSVFVAETKEPLFSNSDFQLVSNLPANIYLRLVKVINSLNKIEIDQKN